VKLIGDVWDSANAEAVRMADEEKDALYVHPFAEADVILGQGTIAMELLEQQQMKVDSIVASVGGGGLLSGIVSCYRAKGDTQTK
jgi:threonine dehydratase